MDNKTHLVFKVSYDGSSFLGLQKTKEGASIEETFEKVLSQILQEPVTLQAASRTDRGVHADSQIIDCKVTKQPKSLSRLLLSLNQLLPPSIRILNIALAPPHFHPSTSSTKKTYRYQISLGPVQLPHHRFSFWHIHTPLDLNLLQQASLLLLGTHDFKAFANSRSNQKNDTTIRSLYRIDTTKNENLLFIEIEGNRFLYKMVRNIVGTLVYIAQGKLPLSIIPELLSSKRRINAGISAPAHGLFLASVHYEQELFANAP